MSEILSAGAKEAFVTIKYAAIIILTSYFVIPLAKDSIKMVKFGDSEVHFLEQTSKNVESQSGELESLKYELGALKVEVDSILKSREGFAEASIAQKVEDYRVEQVGSAERAEPSVAKLAEIRGAQNITGYIWIGNYDKNKSSWKEVTIRNGKNKEYRGDPDNIKKGDSFILDASLNVRSGLPSSGKEYYRSAKVIGVATERSKIKILEAPVPYLRSSSVESYWAKIEVLD